MKSNAPPAILQAAHFMSGIPLLLSFSAKLFDGREYIVHRHALVKCSAFSRVVTRWGPYLLEKTNHPDNSKLAAERLQSGLVNLVQGGGGGSGRHSECSLNQVRGFATGTPNSCC